MLNNWVGRARLPPLVRRRRYGCESERLRASRTFGVDANHKLLDAWLLVPAQRPTHRHPTGSPRLRLRPLPQQPRGLATTPDELTDSTTSNNNEYPTMREPWVRWLAPAALRARCWWSLRSDRKGEWAGVSWHRSASLLGYDRSFA